MNNKIFLKALNRDNTESYVPVWFLRQAGRYMPEYRAVRSQYSDFFKMIKNPDVCTELTLQPLNQFPLDAAITFSDILTIPEALGAKIEFVSGRGPIFKESFKTTPMMELDLNSETKLSYVYEATEKIKAKIDVPLIGFCGSPWTIFTYMFYGESPKDKSEVGNFARNNRAYVHEKLEIISNLTIEYMKNQKKSGADCLQIFDSWGGLIKEDYNEFSLQYVNKLTDAFEKEFPIILYARGMKIKPYINESSAKIFNLNTEDKISEYIDENISIQGNLNPTIFHEDESYLKDLAADIYMKYVDKKNYICNLGSGLTPDIDPAKVALFLNELRFLNSK